MNRDDRVLYLLMIVCLVVALLIVASPKGW